MRKPSFGDDDCIDCLKKVPVDPAGDADYIEWTVQNRANHPLWTHGTTLWEPTVKPLTFSKVQQIPSKDLTAYVIGNGPSRRAVDLNKLDGITYGCNALYRDFSPNFLFANDYNMILEIISSGYRGQCIFADYEPLPAYAFSDMTEQFGYRIGEGLGKTYGTCVGSCDFVPIPTERVGQTHVVWCCPEFSHIEWGYKYFEWGQSTGLFALQRALQNGHSIVKMIGFDGLRGDGHKNVYDGTDLYLYDPSKEDGKRDPDDYVPLAADNWSNIFDKLCDAYSGRAVVKIT